MRSNVGSSLTRPATTRFYLLKGRRGRINARARQSKEHGCWWGGDTDRACHRPQFESNLRHDRVSLPLVAPPLRKAEPSARVFLRYISRGGHIDSTSFPSHVFSSFSRPFLSSSRACRSKKPARCLVFAEEKFATTIWKSNRIEGFAAFVRIEKYVGYSNFETNVRGKRKRDRSRKIEIQMKVGHEHNGVP